MSAEKLATATLRAEERAIVDAEAVRRMAARPTNHADTVYKQSLNWVEDLILARRALFGEPASEPSRLPTPEECKVIAHNVRECGNDERGALVLGLSLAMLAATEPEETEAEKMSNFQRDMDEDMMPGGFDD